MKKTWKCFTKNCLIGLFVLSFAQSVSAEPTATSTDQTSSTSGSASSPSGSGSPVYDQTVSYYLSLIANSINNLFADVDAFYKWMAAAATETLPSSADMITTNTAPESPVDSAKNSDNSTYLSVANLVNYELTTDSLNATLSGARPSVASGDDSTLNFNSLVGPTAYLDGASTGTTQNIESGGNAFGQSGAAYSFIQYLANTVDNTASTSTGTGTSSSSAKKTDKNQNPYAAGGSSSDQGKLTDNALGSSGSNKTSGSKSGGSGWINPRDPSKRSYLNAQNNLIAQQSVGMSSLYYLLGERALQTGLGTKANLQTLPTINADGTINPGTPIADASILQVEEYMAKRRLFNPAWYAQVAGSTSLMSIAKEILYVLVEIRYQQYQDKLLKERELATLASLQLQTLQMNKMLAQARMSAGKQLSNI